VDAINKSAALTDAERIDRLRLIRSDNVGPRTFNSCCIISATRAPPWNGCPIWRGAAALIARRGFAASRMRAPSLPRAKSSASACWRLMKPAIHRGSPCSTMLALRGALEVSMRPMIAIVGSRNASGAGLKFAGQLARDLGEAGFVIVSGLARGID
jgi:DNA processing protein